MDIIIRIPTNSYRKNRNNNRKTTKKTIQLRTKTDHKYRIAPSLLKEFEITKRFCPLLNRK